MLFLVSTPIGNLEDITLRAIRILTEVEYIVCEDTRVTGGLLSHYKIPNNGRMVAFHGHSSNAKKQQIIAWLQEGKDIAVVCDAGTPGISDPGFILVRAALEENIEVSPIPGASAVLSGLVASGMDTHQFLYLGFLPLKKGRQTLFKKLQEKEYTTIIYESVHRIERTLSDFENYFGKDTFLVIGRELTKKFETFTRGTVEEVQKYFAEHPEKLKGEFVIIW